MLKTKWLGVGLVLCGALCTNAEAKLYKWVDDNGTTHYGETIPPEYANKDATRFSDKGRVEKRIEKLTPEEQRAKDAADAKKKASDQAAVETKRKDTALLSTYSNEKEIDLALNRGLQQVEARIGSFTIMLKSAQESLAALYKERDDLTKQGRKIPKSLDEDIVEGTARVEKLQKDLAQNEQEMANVKARFEADKIRFRELKGSATPQ
jgi:hypothetical protein